jgi:hypothetical protein
LTAKRRLAGGRIFGIGLPRTATASLSCALEKLGFRSLHLDLVDAITRREVLDHLTNGAGLRLSALERYDAVSDAPIAATFEALDAAYPRSRFVLTVREKESWLRSCEWLWGQLEPYLREHPEEPYARFLAAVFGALYGDWSFDAERFARAYDAHRERVLSHFAGRRDLLVYDICSGAGWEPLCKFLDVRPPRSPFPRVESVPR